MIAERLHYLGPEGTFTHQAAMIAERQLRGGAADGVVLEQSPDSATILTAVESHQGWGVLAWENNVEGYVVPNLDGLIDAHDAVGITRVGVDIAFDAFVSPGQAEGHPDIGGWGAFAHPHGLAQCRRFLADHDLDAHPTASNAAACRDLRAGQVALGPAICAQLYDLDVYERHVEDYAGARTDFLVLAPRDEALCHIRGLHDGGMAEFESVIAFIPLHTGAGVLANLLDILRDAGLNMTSFISRPIKGHVGTYSFVATIDAAPWSAALRGVLERVVDQGDWVKTLAVYPRREQPAPPVDAWMLPSGGVRGDATSRGTPADAGEETNEESAARRERAAGRELLW